MRIEPAELTLREDGTPYSPRYGDVYHSVDGGPEQARAVFLAGNGLPQRWAGRSVFSVLETGFGIGLNFLVTWQAWQDDPQRCGRLHFLSIEKHPPGAEQLAACHARHPGFSALSAELRRNWPLPLPGMHRLRFAEGRVTLTLVYAEAATALERLDHGFDAFYLDGFAPDRNPEMWQEGLLKACARLAAPGATLATWCATGALREGLARAGFAVERLPGHGRKRHRVAARFAPPDWQAVRPAPAGPAGSALVIGAGLAGAAAAEALAGRGMNVTVLEARVPGAGASGIRAGTLHPHLSPDDAVLSRLVRAGYLLALDAHDRLAMPGKAGIARPAGNAEEEAAMRRTAQASHCPAAYAEFLERDALRERCGLPLARGGYWFAQGLVIEPAALIAAQLAAPGVTLHAAQRVERLAHRDGLWSALDGDRKVIARASVAVLASSLDAPRLSPCAVTLRPVRGQLTCLPGQAIPGLRAAVVGPGYTTNLGDGSLVLGSTFDADDHNTQVEARDHARNLERLRQLCPELDAPPVLRDAQGQAGLRAATADHCPLAGTLPDLDAIRSAGGNWRGAHLRDLPRRPGLYGAFGFGSRGLVWSALAAELLACMACGEPLPVESDLAAATDPARFLLRSLRHGERF